MTLGHSDLGFVSYFVLRASNFRVFFTPGRSNKAGCFDRGGAFRFKLVAQALIEFGGVVLTKLIGEDIENTLRR